MGKGCPLGNVEDGLDPVFEYGCVPFDISKTRVHVGDSTNFICTEGSASTEAPGEGAVEGGGSCECGHLPFNDEGFLSY